MATIVNNNSGAFTGPMSGKTYTLVIGDGSLGLYLQAKVGNLLGKPADEVLLGTPIRIGAGYGNSEGVIPSMEDQPGFVKGLRIDLQKAQTINGQTYATFQVQWGTGSKGKTGGAYAGALMRVNTVFSVGDLREALKKSNTSQTYWRIDP